MSAPSWSSRQKSKMEAISNLGQKQPGHLTPFQSMQRTLAYAKQAKENRKKATYKDTPGGIDPAIWDDMSKDDKKYFAGQGFNIITGSDFERGKGNYQLENHKNQNSGFWQEAAYEMGFGNIKDAKDLLAVRDKANEFGIKDMDSYKDVRKFRERLNQAPDTTTTTESVEFEEPIVDTPVAAAVEQPIEGRDYMTDTMQAAIGRIQEYTNATRGFTAGDQITRTPEPDYDTAQATQDFKDKWTFKIAQNLQPSTQSVVNALTTAIPNKLGVYTG